jgi:hypothetical protein
VTGVSSGAVSFQGKWKTEWRETLIEDLFQAIGGLLVSCYFPRSYQSVEIEVVDFCALDPRRISLFSPPLALPQ